LSLSYTDSDSDNVGGTDPRTSPDAQTPLWGKQGERPDPERATRGDGFDRFVSPP
jgi:hypothetical protein